MAYDLKEKKRDLMVKAEMLKAMASPVRLGLLKELAENEYCTVTYFTEVLGASQSTISQHLAKLRSRQIVTVEYEGTRAKYSLEDDKIKALVKIIFE
ncbi:ArsR/SmtB family transcription factor [Eubacteriales bacterium KG127]